MKLNSAKNSCLSSEPRRDKTIRAREKKKSRTIYWDNLTLFLINEFNSQNLSWISLWTLKASLIEWIRILRGIKIQLFKLLFGSEELDRLFFSLSFFAGETNKTALLLIAIYKILLCLEHTVVVTKWLPIYLNTDYRFLTPHHYFGTKSRQAYNLTWKWMLDVTCGSFVKHYGWYTK